MFAKNKDDCNERIGKTAFSCASFASKPEVLSGIGCAVELIGAIACLSKIRPAPKEVVNVDFFDRANRPHMYERRYFPLSLPQRESFLREPLEHELVHIRIRSKIERKIKADVEKISIDARCNNCGHLQLITMILPMLEKQFDFVCEKCGVKAYLNFPSSSARPVGISSGSALFSS